MQNQTTRKNFNGTMRRGFTLVELLVVIVIVAVLAAITLAVTRSIRQKAYQVNAINSMKQVSAFCMAYSTENNGALNTIRYADKYEGKPDWVKNTFWGRLQPYMFPDADGQGTQLRDQIRLGVQNLFNTSDINKGKWPGTVFRGVTIYGDVPGIPLPFGFNRNLLKWGEWTRISNVADPSRTLYGTYGYYTFDESAGQKYQAMPDYPAKPKSNIYYFENKTVASWFIDGHVEILSPPIPARRFSITP